MKPNADNAAELRTEHGHEHAQPISLALMLYRCTPRIVRVLICSRLLLSLAEASEHLSVEERVPSATP